MNVYDNKGYGEREVVVFSHHNCNDGLGAAATAVEYHTKNGLKQPSVYFLQYGDNGLSKIVKYGYLSKDRELEELPDVAHCDVLMFDFSLSKVELEHMNRVANSMVVLDHHKTAEENLSGLEFAHFDMCKSGAMLAWDYYNPGVEAPNVIKWIQDRDLWLFKEEHTESFTAGITAFSGDKVALIANTIQDDNYMDDIMRDGQVLVEADNVKIASIVKRGKDTFYTIAGYYVNCINNSEQISKVGNKLAVGMPFSAQYFFTKDSIVFSLRSVMATGGVDVSEIAKQFGGGGHSQAAGYSILLKDFDFEGFFTNKKLEVPVLSIWDRLDCWFSSVPMVNGYKYEKLNEQLSILQEEVASNYKWLANQRDIVVDKNEQICNYKNKLAKMSKEIADSNVSNDANVATLTSKLNSAKRDIDGYELTIEAMTATQDKVSGEIKTLLERNMELEAAMADDKVELAKLKEKLAGDKKPKAKHTRRKLNCAKINQARERMNAGENIRDIAKEYNVNYTAILRAVAGETYSKCYKKYLEDSDDEKLLTCKKIDLARTKIASGEKIEDLAEEYCVHVTTLADAINGTTYHGCYKKYIKNKGL